MSQTYAHCFSPDPHSSYFKFLCVHLSKNEKPEPEILIKIRLCACVFFSFLRKKSFCITFHLWLNWISSLHCFVVRLVFFSQLYAIVHKVKWTTMMKQVEYALYKHTQKRYGNINNKTIEKNGHNTFCTYTRSVMQIMFFLFFSTNFYLTKKMYFLHKPTVNAKLNGFFFEISKIAYISLLCVISTRSSAEQYNTITWLIWWLTNNQPQNEPYHCYVRSTLVFVIMRYAICTYETFKKWNRKEWENNKKKWKYFMWEFWVEETKSDLTLKTKWR